MGLSIEINEKIPIHCPHYLIISSLQNRWKQNSKNSNKCLKRLIGNDEIVGLKNWIIKNRFIRKLIRHLVLSFHFTGSHKWRQNTLLPRIIAQNHLSEASTGEIRAGLKLRERRSSFSCSSRHTRLPWSLSSYLLKLTIKCPIVHPISYHFSLHSMLLVSLVISWDHRCTRSCCSYLCHIVAHSWRTCALSPPVSLQYWYPEVGSLHSSVKSHFCPRAFPDCWALTDLRLLNF